MTAAIPTGKLFGGTRREPLPDHAPADLSGFPGAAEVPADCGGDRPGCAWNTPLHLMPGLACGQRCQLGAERPGSAAWYRALVGLVSGADTPVYLLGPRGGQRARLAFVDRGLLLRDDLVGSVLPIPADASLDLDPGADALLPKGARRDARRGERGGLTARWDDSDQAVDAYYAVYLATCDRLALRPLPHSFITAERERAPDAFRLVLAELDGRVVAGKVYLAADRLVRIIEGSALRADGLDALMPDVFLTREVLRDALARGARFVDFGVSEGSHEGLRAFKRRMGFLEDPRVISLERLPELGVGRQDVSLLESCNFGCGFCYREPWAPDFSTAQAKAEIDAVARERRASGIALSGGEPTLREDLPELVTHARSRGIRDVQLHSNGWKLAEEGYAERLEAAGLSSVMISLHAHTPEVFARVTSTQPRYFGRTLTAIDRCRAAGLHTILSHVVNGYNYEGLPAWVRFVAERFPGVEVFFFFVYPSVKGQDHPDMYPRLTDVEPHWYRALAAADEVGLHVTVDNLAGFPPCFMKGFEHHSRFAFTREITERIGDECDDHRVKNPEMRHAAGCAGCRWEDVCPGFWIDYLDRFGEDELRAVR